MVRIGFPTTQDCRRQKIRSLDTSNLHRHTRHHTDRTVLLCLVRNKSQYTIYNDYSPRQCIQYIKNHASEKAVYKLRKRLICLGGPTARLVRFVSECVGRRRHCRCDRRTHSDAERACRAVGPTRYSHRLTRHKQHCLVVSGGRCELGISWLEAGIVFTHEQRRSRR